MVLDEASSGKTLENKQRSDRFCLHLVEKSSWTAAEEPDSQARAAGQVPDTAIVTVWKQTTNSTAAATTATAAAEASSPSRLSELHPGTNPVPKSGQATCEKGRLRLPSDFHKQAQTPAHTQTHPHPHVWTQMCTHQTKRKLYKRNCSLDYAVLPSPEAEVKSKSSDQ